MKVCGHVGPNMRIFCGIVDSNMRMFCGRVCSTQATYSPLTNIFIEASQTTNWINLNLSF